MVARLRVARARATPLGISGTPVTSATQGAAYAGFTVSATGGTPSYVFSIASGALPAGLSINSATGVVYGTPTSSGAFSGIVIRVTDAAGRTASLASFSITVAATRYDDGSSVAKSGAAQYPHALDLSSGTNEFGVTMTTRPSWQVAGVDYRVGPSSTQVYKVLGVDDASLPSGTSYNPTTKYFYVSAGTTVLDGWDLSGYTILSYHGTGSLTVRNCKWICPTGETAFVTDATANSGLLTVEFCDLDCNKQNGGLGSVIHRMVSGTHKTYVHHCLVRNAGNDFMNNLKSFDDVRIMYNVLRDFCWLAANHADAWQEITYDAVYSPMTGLVFRGNTIIQSAADPVTHLPGFFNSIISHGDGATGCVMTNTYMDHNTLVGIGITGHDSPGGYVGIPAFGCILQGWGLSPAGKTNGLYVNNNYVYTDYNAADPSLQGFYSGPWKIRKYADANMANVTIQNNYQMRDGSALEEIVF